MEDQSSVPPAIQASDLLEQIAKVNRMIDLHVEDAFMREQYVSLRQDFLDQLNEVLQTFRLRPTELAA